MTKSKKHQQRQRQPKKSQVRFQSLFEQAEALLKAGNVDPQATSDKFLQAVHAAPLVWTKHRFFAFLQALNLKMEPEGPNATKQDYALLNEQFINNEDEPAHFRAAAAAWAIQEHLTGDTGSMNMSSAAELLRLGLDIIAQSPKENENRIVLHAPYVNYTEYANLGHDDLTLKTILQQFRQRMQQELSRCEGTHSSCPAASSDPEKARLVDRSQAGGRSCDCCGKTPQELQLQKPLMRCSRCLLVYYCSGACQKEDWKEQGHRQACRAPGQIEIGDDMQHRCGVVCDDDGDPCWTDVTFVKVIARVEGATTTHDRWLVNEYGPGGQRLVVESSELIRLRPPRHSS